MSTTMAVHVRYKSLYISLPSSAKWPNSALSGEREPRRLILNLYFKFIAVFQIQSRDSFVSDKQNKRL